jgi:hypothetical protein
MIENLTPEAERRMVLQSLAVTEDEIDHLRSLPTDEARWRIDHEYKVQVEWLGRRRDFVLAEAIKPKVKKKKPTPTGDDVVIVIRHTTSGSMGIVGEKIS